ncbi:MAG: PGPGW domain-containing protein [Candidatus Nanopelagicales bacterium]
MTQQHPELPWNHRFRAWLRKNWLLDTAWRITVFIVGVTLMSVGVLLLVLPGPGWAMIALGLIVLASEYVWAQRLLRPVRSKLAAAKTLAQDPRNRNQVRVATAGAFVLAGVAIGAYVWRYGVSLDGVRSVWPL